MPSPYYAQLGVREQVGLVADNVLRRIIPDVSVQRWEPSNARNESTSTGVLSDPRVAVADSIELHALDDNETSNFVEIVDPKSGHEVVTLIEILSPANKQPGKDRDSYLLKRADILASKTSLIEIDLLRAGGRDIYGPEVERHLAQYEPPLDYLALVQRAWKRGVKFRYQLFPIRLVDMLPVIAVPLRESDAEVTLDLQYAFQQTYDRGPYRRGAVNYDAQPTPELPLPLASWAQERINNWRAS